MQNDLRTSIVLNCLLIELLKLMAKSKDKEKFEDFDKPNICSNIKIRILKK